MIRIATLSWQQLKRVPAAALSPRIPSRPMYHSDPLPRFAGGAVLRRLSPADLAAFQAYRHDPVLGQYQGWSATSDAEASAFLIEMSLAPLFQPGEWCQIGIADAQTLDLIGDIGLFLADDGRQVEIGFTLAPQAQGRGLGTAAVREAINLVFERTEVERVIGITDARNSRSIRLLERVGMHWIETNNALFRGEPCVEHTYAILRS